MSRMFVPYLQVVHAFFNLLLFAGFLRLGFLGRGNRRRRKAAGPADFAAIRRHRRLGQALAWLLPAGYIAGLLTAFLDKRAWLPHPAHLAVGTFLLLVLGAVVLTANRIRGATSPWRTPHVLLGLALLSLFAVQTLLGAAILL